MDSPSRVQSINISWFFALGAVAITLVGLFGFLPYTYGYGHLPVPLGTMLWGLWNDYGDWQHGMIVPILVGWLVYRRLKLLPSIPVQPSRLGLVLVILGFFFYWVGYKADIQYIGFLATQWLVAAIAIWFLGWRTFSEFLFPWMLITFMWPFLFLDNMIAFPLRIIMSEVSYQFLDLIGLDVVKQGTAVLSASNPALGLAAGERFAVDIADPCSGIRSLFALMLITCLYGYLTLHKDWQRWVLFLMAAPLAILGNFFRILMLVAGTLAVNSDFAIGTIDKPSTFHMLAGFLVFAVALAGMVALGKLLKSIGRTAP